MDQETAKHLYENLRQSYPNTTIILSTHATNIVEGDDIVMLFKKGMFKEIGRYRELLAKKESYIHELLEIDDREHQQHSGE
jgi:ABC-type bacteriocin/lantibiotic exporter with double-glycine peptidase domain